ncbi:MAG: hypothetical protein JWP72_876 [Massilia sp.]|nr:hypothetical protein [Massilia sp.]
MAIESPISAVASLVASTKSAPALPPTASTIRPRTSSAGNRQSAFWANVPVGCSCRLTMASVRTGRIFEIASAAPVVSMSQPNTRSASPVAMRWARRRSGDAATFTCEVTEPFFCLMPVMSSTEATLPSRCAAMPISAPTVMTPVPPIPLIRMLYGCSTLGSTGSARAPQPSSASPLVTPARLFLSVPPSTVTKLWQKPFTHE